MELHRISLHQINWLKKLYKCSNKDFASHQLVLRVLKYQHFCSSTHTTTGLSVTSFIVSFMEFSQHTFSAQWWDHYSPSIHDACIHNGQLVADVSSNKVSVQCMHCLAILPWCNGALLTARYLMSTLLSVLLRWGHPSTISTSSPEAGVWTGVSGSGNLPIASAFA